MADDPVATVMTAFNEFKAATDDNLKKRDVVLEEKLNNLQNTLDQHEAANQKLLLAAEKQAALQAQLDKLQAAMQRPGLPGANGDAEAREYREAFDRVIRKAPQDRDPKDSAILAKYRNVLVKGDDAGAGYLAAPPDIQRDILKDVIEISPVRALATVRNIGGPSFKRPKRTSAAGAATRVGERETRTDTGDPAYGMISIDAPEMFARARISQQMLEDSDYDLLAELREEFSTQFALKEGLEFLEGAGAANQAEGLLTAAGVTEVVSGHASEIKADALINIYYGLKSFYTGNARWLLNRLTVRDIRKLKDGNGVFIWAPGIAGATPNTILGTPYVEIPGMDNVGAGNYPVIFGDIKRAYTVVDRIGMQMQTDFTTGADDGIVIFRARKRVGGGTVQPEAYQKLKIAAS
jgi:HK97 family phage major capsid protein